VSPYCDVYGGAVINATIDRYATATLEFNHDDRIIFCATDVGMEESFAAEGRLPADEGLRLHRGVYNRMVAEFNEAQPYPVKVTTFVESPLGSGLGSSSALVVALVQAFAHAMQAPLGEHEVASLAFEIERVDLGLAGGRQDQFAAAFGGVNFLEFGPGPKVIVNPLRIRSSTIWELEESLVLVFTGASRQSAEIINTQMKSVSTGGDSLQAMHDLKAEAVAMKEALLFGRVQEMAAILTRGWLAKKATSSAVSNPLVESIFEKAFKAGALAGKVSGAGGGGFMMFMVDPKRRSQVMSCLAEEGLSVSGARFTTEGCVSWEPKVSTR
jgi:D-glycero-alpha-D-manno-heptose-7-phosphate kinase